MVPQRGMVRQAHHERSNGLSGLKEAMRLTDRQIHTIRQLARQVTGDQTRVRVFGSKLDDTARGGDIDLMLELSESVDNPALMAAQMSALVSRAMHGRKECQHLATTDRRLFGVASFSVVQATLLEEDPDLAERVEAFVGRFGRLQDTVGDKLLPLLLDALGEKTFAVIDNLDRAERLELIKSAANG